MTRVRIERHEMPETNPRPELIKPQAGLENKQTARLMIALTLLLVALSVVLVKDREFWFGSDTVAESSAADSENISNSSAAAAKTAQAPVTPTSSAKNKVASKSPTPAVTASSHKAAASLSSETPVTSPASPLVATNRVALPAMDVEVVAGDTHRMVRSGSNVAKVEIPTDSNRTITSSAVNLQTSAVEREHLSSASVPELRQTVETTYPLLGQHTRVQGSVVLQAVVGADGVIENLRVLSGPAVLATAAEQAVRQWRFRPYMQNGQPVETKARITVNFTIRISDDAKSS